MKTLFFAFLTLGYLVSVSEPVFASISHLNECERLLVTTSGGAKVRRPFLVGEIRRTLDRLGNQSAVLLQVTLPGRSAVLGHKVPVADIAFLKNGYYKTYSETVGSSVDQYTLEVKDGTLNMAVRHSHRDTNGFAYLRITQIDSKSMDPKKAVNWVRTLSYVKSEDGVWALTDLNDYGMVPDDVSWPSDDLVEKLGQ